MGHERIGLLPKSKQWRQLVADISKSSLSEYDLDSITKKTLENVRSRFLNIHKDSGVRAAFSFLISLATSESYKEPYLESSQPNIDLESNPSSFLLSKKVYKWVSAHSDSLEYAELAQKSAIDTIASWENKQGVQRSLFTDRHDAITIWSKASTGRGFCEVARLFFSSFTNRYLKYFLEREASSSFRSIDDRDKFSENLHEHVDSISKHAFETSKITQSFAAGWFNKHTKNTPPSDHDIEKFLSLAFSKIREELWREGNA